MNNEKKKNRKVIWIVLHIVVAVILTAMLIFGIHSIAYAVSFRHDIAESAKQMTDAKQSSVVSSKSVNDLKSKCPDCVGWLTIDDTVIDFPIVQGKDNFEYLTKDAFGNESKIGSAFLDSSCASDFSSHYNIIHGHYSHMGVFFDDLCKFEDQEYFNNHKTGSVVTQNQTINFKIFACIHPDKTDSYIYKMLPVLSECDRSHDEASVKNAAKSRTKLYDYILENAAQKRNVTLNADSKVIAFSTCANNNDERTVVFAQVIINKEK